MSSSDLTQYFIELSTVLNPDWNFPNSVVCLSQDMALEGPYNLTLDGESVVDGVAVFNAALRLNIVSSGDLSGVTFTITGTDLDGNVLVESLNGSDGDPTSATTVNYFKTVTQIESDGGDGSEILGSVGAFGGGGGAVRLFAGPGRVRSIYISGLGGDSNPVILHKDSAIGPAGFSFMCDSASHNILFPDYGIRFPDGCYVTFPSAGVFNGLTALVS